MKQLLKVLMLMLVLVLAIGVLVACNDDAAGGGNTDGEGSGDAAAEEEGDVNGKFTVTFKYIDKNGNELKDVGGFSEHTQKNIKYGKDVRDNLKDDVTAFEKYVVTGWNTDKDAAKAGTADENALKNVKDNRTVYSVIRDKVEKKITFLAADGKTVIGTRNYLEGSVIGTEAPRPKDKGVYFKQWEFVKNDEGEGTTNSRVDCIFGAASFKAVLGATDGTIGKTSATINVDAIKDEAYVKSNAYLALNNQKQADGSVMAADNDGKGRADARDTKADTWMVWDGNYIYLLIEVYDTSLASRSDSYTKGGIDAWFNDAVEIWYNFEQDATLTKNETRIGLGVMGDRDTPGDGKYAVNRKLGIHGGRSTHYEEITYAVRNYLLGDRGDDLDRNGVDKPSYIMEFKFPAKTEGEANTEHDAVKGLKGVDLENFKATGRLPGFEEDENDITAYAFTDGNKLAAGDFVRFCLQVNDLKIANADLSNPAKYLDGYSFNDLKAMDSSFTQKAYDENKIKLFALKEGKVVGASTNNLFAAAGSTQRNLSMYLMFSLGSEEEGSYEVASFRKVVGSPNDKQIMLKADGSVYERVTDVGDN